MTQKILSYTSVSFTTPGLVLVPNETHPFPAQHPTLRRNPSSSPWPLYLSTLDNNFLFCDALILPLSLYTFLSCSSWKTITPRPSHGCGHSGLRSNATFCHRTSQPRMPFPSTVPLCLPQSPCHSMKFILMHLPFLSLKRKFC